VRNLNHSTRATLALTWSLVQSWQSHTLRKEVSLTHVVPMFVRSKRSRLHSWSRCARNLTGESRPLSHRKIDAVVMVWEHWMSALNSERRTTLYCCCFTAVAIGI
jgi:hypothetical protein